MRSVSLEDLARRGRAEVQLEVDTIVDGIKIILSTSSAEKTIFRYQTPNAFIAEALVHRLVYEENIAAYHICEGLVTYCSSFNVLYSHEIKR